ncbi:DUF6768 family protein [Hyphococcus sp.]|uniref:DUF6768 family protein n=1 Tax=Hyphococcus sp. TaxID=2038636 RepID=UPI00208C7788|nr:MAG: hypothetical protein DHS20C04_18170 [Marinicaulis sp.]
MDDLDRKIEAALTAEDRALLEQFGEQGLFAQAFGVFTGKQGWIALMATIVTFVIFAAAVYCGWKFYNADAALEATRWGAGAIMLMIMTGFLKIWFWLRMESNRVLREVKRLELQMARMQGK